MNALRVPILGQAGGRTDLKMDNGIASLGYGVLEASASPSGRSGILGLEVLLSGPQRLPSF